jgi:hypothetical protein
VVSPGCFVLLVVVQCNPEVSGYLDNKAHRGLLSGYGNLVSQWLEVLLQKAFYVGVPAVSSAFQKAREAFAEAGLRGETKCD